MRNKTPAQTLADKIVKDLFTNGRKDEADRLVLTTKAGSDLGGWCREAVRDVILRHLGADQ